MKETNKKDTTEFFTSIILSGTEPDINYFLCALGDTNVPDMDELCCYRFRKISHTRLLGMLTGKRSIPVEIFYNLSIDYQLNVQVLNEWCDKFRRYFIDTEFRPSTMKSIDLPE